MGLAVAELHSTYVLDCSPRSCLGQAYGDFASTTFGPILTMVMMHQKSGKPCFSWGHEINSYVVFRAKMCIDHWSPIFFNN